MIQGITAVEPAGVAGNQGNGTCREWRETRAMEPAGVAGNQGNGT